MSEQQQQQQRFVIINKASFKFLIQYSLFVPHKMEVFFFPRVVILKYQRCQFFMVDLLQEGAHATILNLRSRFVPPSPPSQKIRLRDLLNKIRSDKKGDWGKEKESERNITRPLPVFTFAISPNLSKLLSWPLRKKKHMLNVKKSSKNMTDHLHFVHLAPWLETLNCVFFPWRQTTRPAFN